jgi:hypothetical protein
VLRILVLLLVLANGAFFLWSQGRLAAWGLVPQDQREPARLQQQIAPDAIRLIQAPTDQGAPVAPDSGLAPAESPDPSPDSVAPEPPPTPSATATARQAPALTEAPPAATPARPAPAPALTAPTRPPVAAPVFDMPSPGPTRATPASAAAGEQTRACWQANGFTQAQAETLRASLSLLGLPAGTWQLREFRSPGRWLVYLGRYDNTAQMQRKMAELRALKIEARTVSSPGLAPGLSLGAYPTEAAAQQALQSAARKGVRTARVAQELAESVGYGLRLPSALPGERSAVAALGPALAGKTLQACN